MEKERNRNLMLYEFKCGHSAAAATKNICRIEGAGTVKESTCRRWFAKFRTGEEGLRDKNRSGRPLAYNLEDFRQTTKAIQGLVFGDWQQNSWCQNPPFGIIFIVLEKRTEGSGKFPEN
jgi:transposase